MLIYKTVKAIYWIRERILTLFLLLLGVPIGIIALMQHTQLRQQAQGTNPLPGQQIWKNGVSSYLFGMNDTYEYSIDNIESDPKGILQPALKNTGVPFMRSFFSEQHIGAPFDHTKTTDADIDQRLKTIENIGAQCLGVIAYSGNPTYASSDTFIKHLISYAGNRCQIWEFGNEPFTNLSMQQYLDGWNRLIPQLRTINPSAKFGGPVSSGYNGSQIQAFLQGTKASGILPDFITYHDYPCYQISNGSSCDQQVQTSFSQHILAAKALIKSTLGVDLPVGVTEWNVDPSNQQTLGLDSTYMPHFVTEVINAMIQNGLSFANYFDAKSAAGYGNLDIFDSNDQPRPWLGTFQNLIANYSTGNNPTSAVTNPTGVISFSTTICPHGLGDCGDNVNPNGGGNTNPKHTSRLVTITLRDTSGQTVVSAQGSISYNTSSNTFQGSLQLTSPIAPGAYLVSLKMDGFLSKQVPGIISISTGQQTVSLPSVSETTGDVNNDDQLDILDYNIIIGCFGSKQSTSSCTTPPTQISPGADLNDDGKVDGIDYNLFLRELSVQKGTGGTPTPTPSSSPTPTGTVVGTHHYEYVANDGSLSVYDMDNNFSFIKKISLPSTADGIRGIVGHIGSHALYISHGSDSSCCGSLLKMDLVTDSVVYDKKYSHGIDSMAITPDGTKVYMPDGELASDGKWYVSDAATGNDTGTVIDTGSGTNDNGPHNTIVSLDGQFAYLGDRNLAHSGSNYFYIASTGTNQITKKVGPFISGIRPFTINGKHTLVYTAITGFLGFQVGDLSTGKVIYTVDLTKLGFPNTPGPTAPSHGVALRPDEKQLAVIDWPNDMVHIFDVTSVPSSAPQKIADIKFSRSMHHNESSCAYDCAADGWLEYSRDGKYLFVGDVGDAIDTSSNKFITNIPTLYNTRKMLEVDFQNGQVSYVPTNRASVGFVTQ